MSSHPSHRYPCALVTVPAFLLPAGALVVLLLLAALAFVLWRLLHREKAAAAGREHQQRLQALGEMSAVLAHELKNPLASLKGNAQLLARRLPEGGRDRRKADRLVVEVSRLEALCLDLLDFCRDGPLERRPFDPLVLLYEAIDEIVTDQVTRGEIEADSYPDARTRGFRIDAAASTRQVSIDPVRLRRAVVNLLRNAQQASPEGEPVSVRVATEPEALRIVVRDRGPGLPEDIGDRIFEPFVTTRSQGTGLGLAVARRVVVLHGGTLTAANAADGGAELTIVLPEAPP